MARRKTPTMRLIEMQHGEPIESLLRRLYVDEGKTLAEVGKELGISEGAVYNWMGRLDIPTRPPGVAASH